MSVHTACDRSAGGDLGLPAAPGRPALSIVARSRQLQPESETSAPEDGAALLRPVGKAGGIDSTYVISACEKPEGDPLPPHPAGRLTLQRRVTRSKDSSLLGGERGGVAEKTAEPRLMPQRCTEADAVEKQETKESNHSSPETSINWKVVNNDKTFFVAPSVPPAADPKDAEVQAAEKNQGTFPALSGAGEGVALGSSSDRAPVGSRGQTEAVRSGRSATRPVQSKLDVRASETGNLYLRSAGKDVAKLSNKCESLEKRMPSKSLIEHRCTPKRGLPQLKSPAALVPRSRVPSLQVKQMPKSSLLASKRERLQESTFLLEEEPALRKTSAETDPLKVENSQVTVAVRVRPFSSRETTERSPQVVFLNGDEVAVEHPGLRQVYSFVYDLAFWSVDKRHPGFASQTAVYAALAAPLLQQAFQGYNTCLFAYGQTGSGKSYTMMGFSEEPGIIPRFCEDLFAQVAKKQTQEVSYHLEMSFFEVYNEKIHDLLICENGQRKQTLRVREHPTSGPYVEGLSTNVVSSYSDVQVWLELGNKKKATAATGMNDKSSRSHSVLTLVMTQTKTEFVEGEELDHRVRSRVNLVDLAGSERCPMTQTSGERLKEGVSINKSLLTLGKVISALSERAHGKRVFIPYRESVLTWLLKESLSGNSKTAMVATVSPAASSVEETLGALRYATQARAIVNVARVNEDVSARLIRELKAEIEKLQAAQRSSHNIDPERYRLCRQEITSLRMKLHQQERDMADMQRMWKEKFEQAEKRKLQVTKELQKAGITFQMDNHLPNLVNLNEDPQLSEILLYMLKEGTTTVGKRRPSSSHDIQLAGVLIAEDHCTISNVDGTVSITPVGEAKTYINGKLILEPTVLHHGDRVILGGDHYFRFNHPGGVQKGDRPSGRETLMSKGAKDFEFAKNDLLAAQRGQLEAEIKEAQLKAKEEMMQGIQIVKEMAQQELSSQKAAYESRISALEAELKEESQRKRMQEINNQKATHKIEELEKAKQHFEQEAHASRKRLEMEALATKQALEDHRIRHAKILEALEAEKQRIAKEVQILQQNQSSRDRPLTIQPNWGSMKLSLMIQEANAVSKKLEKNYVFGRHVVPDKGGGSDTCVQVRNLQLGVSTVWSLEKFESKLAAMKELYESYSSNRSEDVFCDPADEWEPDITDVPVSSFSRRRSRSLMKNRRVSSCLLDIAACSAQDARPSRSSGLAGKSGTVYPGSAESPLPGVCRELIGSSLELLGQSYGEENTVADSLVSNLLRICEGILAVSKAHEEQDEDSQCDVFSSGATQLLTVQVASAFEQLVVLTRLWLRGELPGGSAAALPDELRQEVKRLGGCLQLFLQGCSSDISSVVKEAQKQVTQAVLRAVKRVGQLAALRGTELHPPENSDRRAAGGQDDFMDALCDGVGLGLEHLLDSGLEKAEVLARELLRQDTPSEVTKRMKASAVGLIASLEHLFTEWKTKSFRTQEENSGYQDLKKMVNLAPEFLKLKRGLEQTIQMTVSALRGCRGDVSLLKNCVESLCSSARAVQAGGPASARSSVGSGARGDHGALGSLATSLLLCFESEERLDLLEPWDTCNQGPGAEG
nr:kinesin-like protein KIF14 [Camelus dromedarius]XP_031294178.1 kinesin-like protein KIF14 [Camelus dromedarius]